MKDSRVRIVFDSPTEYKCKSRKKGHKEDCKSLNEFIDILQSKIYDVRKHLIESGRSVFANAIKDILGGFDWRRLELFSIFRNHNDPVIK